MKHYKKIQVLKIKNNKEALDHFIAAHYLRPDKEDRGYEDYKEDELDNYQEIFHNIPKIIQMVIWYDSSMGIHIIFELDFEAYEEDTRINQFMSELQGDFNNIVNPAGTEKMTIYYNQQI